MRASLERAILKINALMRGKLILNRKDTATPTKESPKLETVGYRGCVFLDPYIRYWRRSHALQVEWKRYGQVRTEDLVTSARLGRMRQMFHLRDMRMNKAVDDSKTMSRTRQACGGLQILKVAYNLRRGARYNTH